MAKLKIEQDAEATIRFLRYLTGGEGYASISVFDAGAGGGFSEGSLDISLERSGLLLNKKVYSVDELKELILFASNHVFKDMEKTNDHYKKYPWND